MDAEHQRIIKISDELNTASNKVRILRNIAWSVEIKDIFFKNKAQVLPKIEYPNYDPKPALENIKTVRGLIGSTDVIDNWASGIADKIESSAMLLATRGTANFFKHSLEMYGHPSQEVSECNCSTLDLATHFDELFKGLKNIDLGAPPEACILSSVLAEDMQQAVTSMFGDLAPEIVMDKTLASNALAGRRRISIRPTACFTDKDIKQLIEHEAFIHVATSINGNLQPHPKIL